MIKKIVKPATRTCIEEKQQHPNYVGTSKNLHPMPQSSNKFNYKKGGKNKQEGGLDQNPQNRKEKAKSKKQKNVNS
jgi:hypothetical protein